MTSNLKLTCELIAGLFMLPGFIGLAAFVLAIAPDTRADRAIAYGTAQSPFGSSLQAVSPAPPLPSTIAGEQP